ncbi:unnamed protein product, partial [Brassica oleracea var. botrytis]
CEIVFRLKIIDSMNTNEMSNKRARKETETLVLWDINGCPVPKNCNAGLRSTSRYINDLIP